MLLAAACAGSETSPAPSDAPSSSPGTSMRVPTPSPGLPFEPQDALCSRVTELTANLGALRDVELRLPNRVALDIELDRLLMSFRDLEDVDLGEAEDRLAGSLKRLGYRLGELELAVEDFRTNPRPRRAAPHVEEDAQKVADELDAFTLLSRC